MTRPPGGTRATSRHGVGGRRDLVSVLFLLVLTASVVNVVLAVGRGDAGEAPAEPRLQGEYRVGAIAGPAADAVPIAVSGVVDVLTADHQHPDATVRAAAQELTPRFARRFERAFDSGTVPGLRRQRLVTRGVVDGAGLIRASEKRAVVLVFADQLEVSRSGLRPKGDPVLEALQVRVRVVRVDGAWLVDDMTPL